MTRRRGLSPGSSKPTPVGGESRVAVGSLRDRALVGRRDALELVDGVRAVVGVAERPSKEPRLVSRAHRGNVSARRGYARSAGAAHATAALGEGPLGPSSVLGVTFAMHGRRSDD